MGELAATYYSIRVEKELGACLKHIASISFCNYFVKHSNSPVKLDILGEINLGELKVGTIIRYNI